MEKRAISHPDRDVNFVTGAYSVAVLVEGVLLVSGQAPVDFKTSQFVLVTI